MARRFHSMVDFLYYLELGFHVQKSALGEQGTVEITLHYFRQGNVKRVSINGVVIRF